MLTNKKRLIKGGKVTTLFVGALLTIAVCAGVWSLASSAALSVAAGALFAGNAYAIVKYAKNLKD